MKKFLSALMIALIVTFSANICAANRYDDDPDYVYVMAHGQGIVYLYIRSIDVQEYNPPHYQIAGTFVHVSGMYHNLGKTTTYYVTKRYNWYTKETFRRNDYGNWEKDYNVYHAKVEADALFRAAYGMDFYGY